jgi:signal transduction histidine kinase
MLSLRKKFLIGSAGLVSILALSAAVGVFVAWRANSAVEQMLRANYDTLLACHGMEDAVARLDVDCKSWVIGYESPDWDSAIAQFDKNLLFQQHNVTEPGEQEITDHLTTTWVAYWALTERYLKMPTQGRRRLFEHELQPMQAVMLLDCHQIIGLNLKAVPQVQQRAQQLAKDAAQWGSMLLLLATLVVSGGVAFLGRWVINPIRAVTESVREIAAGNLDLEVASAGDDEVGQLAQSFNLMAARLREFRRSDQARLLQFQRSTQQALDALSDGVAFLGSDGRVELANPVAQRLFELRPGLAPGPGCPRELTAALAEALAGRPNAASGDYRQALQVFDGGQERFFLPRLQAVLQEKNVAGLALVLVDVTVLLRMDEMKSSVVATVSHELKTPLTGLRMALHLLLNERTGPLNAQQEELALGARQDAERLHRILIELLDLGRLEQGRAALDLQAQPVRPLLEELAAQQAPAFASKGVRLQWEQAQPELQVLADSGRLKHVFSNLLDNALRFTPQGGLVTLRAEASGSGVRFSVSDTGPGIDEADLPRVFEKFYRAPGQGGGGVGLGLAIVKEIVEAHGGRIAARSRPGVGAAFDVDLPSPA